MTLKWDMAENEAKHRRAADIGPGAPQYQYRLPKDWTAQERWATTVG